MASHRYPWLIDVVHGSSLDPEAGGGGNPTWYKIAGLRKILAEVEYVVYVDMVRKGKQHPPPAPSRRPPAPSHPLHHHRASAQPARRTCW